MYSEQCKAVSSLIHTARLAFYQDKIQASDGQKELFRVVQSLLCCPKSSLLPYSTSTAQLADDFLLFITGKVQHIRDEVASEVGQDSPMAPPTREPEFTGAPLSSFLPTTSAEVLKLLGKAPSRLYELDPLPTWMLKQYATQMAPLLTQIVNLSLVEGQVPAQMKQAIMCPLLKKTSLDHDHLRNYKAVSNLSFLSKLLDRVVAAHLQDHLAGNDIGEQFQSAYKPLHSTETALICIYNDIMRATDDGRVGMLIMLDLSAAFDTVDHGLLLDRLRVVGVRSKVLSWFRSYLDNCHQCVVAGASAHPVWC